MESAAEYKWRTYWLHVRREGGERGEREREIAISALFSEVYFCNFL